MDSRNQNKGKESNETSRSEDSTPIYLTGDSTLQTPEEDRRDSSIDPRQDTAMDPSRDDLHETAADRLAGSDRAGTAERKENSMDTNSDDEATRGEA